MDFIGFRVKRRGFTVDSETPHDPKHPRPWQSTVKPTTPLQPGMPIQYPNTRGNIHSSGGTLVSHNVILATPAPTQDPMTLHLFSVLESSKSCNLPNTS